MCGLIFTEDVSLWPSLVAANLSRAGKNKGALTFTAWERGLTEMETLDTTHTITGPDHDFPHPGVVHLQAPTSSVSKPHPAWAPQTLVWHNGLLFHSSITRLRDVTECKSFWDTELIAAAVSCGFTSDAFATLGKIAGSFAVVAFHCGEMYAFRNAMSPLFRTPGGSTLSSVATGDVTESVPPGVVYTLVDGEGWLSTQVTFDTSYNQYGI